MTNSHLRGTFAALLLCAGTGCSDAKHQAAPALQTSENQAPSAQQQIEVTALATRAIDPFKKQLSQALMSALQEQGPGAAIEVCSQKAPQLAAEASTDAIQVGRSALKLRNPENAARDWLTPVLREMAALTSPEGAERVVALGGQRFGYAQAITLKPQCALCHGTAVPAEVASKLKELYPNDQATGFEPGQLRGVFWAEVALKN